MLAFPGFVPLPTVQQLLARATEPKRLWVVDAADHRFSDRLPAFDTTLLEATAWVREHVEERGGHL